MMSSPSRKSVSWVIWGPTDLCVITCSEKISAERAARIHIEWVRLMGPDHKLLILDGGTQIGVIGDG
jgi:hypothetical protein